MHRDTVETPVGSVGGTLGLALLIAGYVLILANALYPVLRLTIQPANYAFFVAAAALPVRVLLVSQRLRGWRRISFGSLALVLLVVATVFGIPSAAWAVISFQRDASFERLRSVAAGGHTVAIYRTNGGAMASYGITLRQECALMPGLQVVRDLGGEYPAFEAVVGYNVSGVLQATFPAYSDRRSGATMLVLHLRHWCWGGIEERN